MKLILCLLLGSLVAATDADSQWSQLTGLSGGGVSSFYRYNSQIFASTANGLFVSSDEGHRWSHVEIQFPSNMKSCKLLWRDDEVLLLQVDRDPFDYPHLFRSADNGKTFVKLFDSANTYAVTEAGGSLFLARDYRYSSTDKRNLLQSTDRGATWSTMTSPKGMMTTITGDGKNLFAIVTSPEGSTDRPAYVWRSFDLGVTWDTVRGGPQKKYQPLHRWPSSLSVVVRDLDTVLWVGCRLPFECSNIKPTQTPTVYHVNNRQTTWQPAGSFQDIDVANVRSSSDAVFVTLKDTVWKYDIDSDRWTNITYDLKGKSKGYHYGFGTFLPVHSTTEDYLLTSYGGSILRLDSNSEQYIPSDTGMSMVTIYHVLSHRDTLYASTYLWNQSLVFSTDRGVSWHPTDYREHDQYYRGNMLSSAHGILMGYDDVIDLVSNRTYKVIAEVPWRAYQLFRTEDTIYCRSDKWLVSGDEGISWVTYPRPAVNSFGPGAAIKGCIIQTGDTLARSTDGAQSWQILPPIHDKPYYTHSAVFMDSMLFASVRVKWTHAAVFRSDDRGESWQMISPELSWNAFGSGGEAAGVYPVQGFLLCGNSDGVYLSDIRGRWWRQMPVGSGIVTSITHDAENVYVGTLNSGIWKASIAELKTLAHVTATPTTPELPLVTIYPNPTTGSLSLDVDAPYASLEILDLTGRVVLSSAFQESYDVYKLSSGFYYLNLLDKDRMLIGQGKFTKE